MKDLNYKAEQITKEINNPNLTPQRLKELLWLSHEIGKALDSEYWIAKEINKEPLGEELLNTLKRNDNKAKERLKKQLDPAA